MSFQNYQEFHIFVKAHVVYTAFNATNYLSHAYNVLVLKFIELGFE